MPGLLPPFLRSGKLDRAWLYSFLARDITWGRTPKTLERFSLNTTIAIIVLMGISMAVSWGMDWEAGFWIVGLIAAFSFIIVDFASVFFGITTAQSQIDQFDLLRITPIRGPEFVTVFHQVAQTRAWRVLIFMQAMRLALVGVLFTFGIGIVIISVLFTMGAGAILIISLVILALSEPVWRLQMMTAIGVVAGIRIEGTLGAWGVGFGLMLLVWILQGAIGLIPFWIMRIFEREEFVMIFALTVCLAVMTWFIRWAQKRICKVCLQRAEQSFG